MGEAEKRFCFASWEINCPRGLLAANPERKPQERGEMRRKRLILSPQPVEKVRRKLGFFAFLWYNTGEGS